MHKHTPNTNSQARTDPEVENPRRSTGRAKIPENDTQSLKGKTPERLEMVQGGLPHSPRVLRQEWAHVHKLWDGHKDVKYGLA